MTLVPTTTASKVEYMAFGPQQSTKLHTAKPTKDTLTALPTISICNEETVLVPVSTGQVVLVSHARLHLIPAALRQQFQIVRFLLLITAVPAVPAHPATPALVLTPAATLHGVARVVIRVPLLVALLVVLRVQQGIPVYMILVMNCKVIFLSIAARVIVALPVRHVLVAVLRSAILAITYLM